MESTRFDDLTHRLGHARSRRALLGAGFAAMTMRVGPAAAKTQPAAHCSKHKPCPVCLACHKRKCKPQPDGTVCSGGTCVGGQCQTNGCTPNCDRKICGPDGCGGSCGTCGGDAVCRNGQCQSPCPDGRKLCVGVCIASNLCCFDADCAPEQTCCQGTCRDTQIDPLHCGGCDTICAQGQTCSAGACCIARNGDCQTDGDCCGTDLCHVGTCLACVPAGGSCFAVDCCPGLHCTQVDVANFVCVAG